MTVKKAAERIPWGKVLAGGAIALGGILGYNALRNLSSGLPSLADLFGGLGGGAVGGGAEVAGGALGGALKGALQFPLAIGEAVGARGWGESAFDVVVDPYIESRDVIAHLQWTGEQPSFTPQGITTPLPVQYIQHVLSGALVQPQAQLGGSTKQFLIEAPWREDPTMFAELGPWAAQYMEAQRTRFEEAGLI